MEMLPSVNMLPAVALELLPRVTCSLKTMLTKKHGKNCNQVTRVRRKQNRYSTGVVCQVKE